MRFHGGRDNRPRHIARRRQVYKGFCLSGGDDVKSFVAMAQRPGADKRVQRTRWQAEPGLSVIGVDRLDYSKGLPEKFRAFRRLLEMCPDKCKPASLIQIASPTRNNMQSYIDIRHELETLSGAINGSSAISTGRQCVIFTERWNAKRLRLFTVKVGLVSSRRCATE